MVQEIAFYAPNTQALEPLQGNLAVAMDPFYSLRALHPVQVAVDVRALRDNGRA
jgi:hypothetical protein